jgi:hypothetical protein
MIQRQGATTECPHHLEDTHISELTNDRTRKSSNLEKLRLSKVSPASISLKSVRNIYLGRRPKQKNKGHERNQAIRIQNCIGRLLMSAKGFSMTLIGEEARR